MLSFWSIFICPKFCLGDSSTLLHVFKMMYWHILLYLQTTIYLFVLIYMDILMISSFANYQEQCSQKILVQVFVVNKLITFCWIYIQRQDHWLCLYTSFFDTFREFSNAVIINYVSTSSACEFSCFTLQSTLRIGIFHFSHSAAYINYSFNLYFPDDQLKLSSFSCSLAEGILF